MGVYMTSSTLSCSGKLPSVTEMSLQGRRQEEKVSSAQTGTSANTASDAKWHQRRERQGFMVIFRPGFDRISCQMF